MDVDVWLLAIICFDISMTSNQKIYGWELVWCSGMAYKCISCTTRSVLLLSPNIKQHCDWSMSPM